MSDLAQMLLAAGVSADKIQSQLHHYYTVENRKLSELSSVPSFVPEWDAIGKPYRRDVPVTIVRDENKKIQAVLLVHNNQYEIFTGANPPSFKLRKHELEIEHATMNKKPFVIPLAQDQIVHASQSVDAHDDVQPMRFDLREHQLGSNQLTVLQGKVRVQYGPQTSVAHVVVNGSNASADIHLPSSMAADCGFNMPADKTWTAIRLGAVNGISLGPEGDGANYSVRLHVEAKQNQKTFSETLHVYRSGEGRVRDDFDSAFREAAKAVEKQAQEARKSTPAR